MKKLLTHPDTIMRGHFGSSLLDPGCSSSARYHFEPTLGSEGSIKSEWLPPAVSGSAAKGSDRAGRPVSTGFEAAIEGLDEARRPNSVGSKATVEGPRVRPPPPTRWRVAGRARMR